MRLALLSPKTGTKGLGTVCFLASGRRHPGARDGKPPIRMGLNPGTGTATTLTLPVPIPVPVTLLLPLPLSIPLPLPLPLTL